MLTELGHTIPWQPDEAPISLAGAKFYILQRVSD